MRAFQIIILLLSAALLSGCAAAAQYAGSAGETAEGGAAPPTSTRAPVTSVAFVGDSLTARCELGVYYPGREAYNLGVDGDTVENVSERIAQVYALKPSAVVLLAGINDLAGMSATPEAVAIELGALLADIRENLPEAHIFVQSLYPVNATVAIPISAALGDRVAETNALLAGLCDKEGYIYIDVYSALLDENGALGAEYTEDGVHLSARGYEVASAKIDAALSEAS